MPHFPVPDGYSPVSYLREVAEKGLRERLRLSDEDSIPSEYWERLVYELDVMVEMGFPTYFLVVWDYIRFAREKGIPVGPGRGSAAGSLVAYALCITNIDPVSNGLLFERFLNPERKSLPDIDTDFCIQRRGEVIDYVTRRYGEDKVAQIITFNRMTSKAVLKDVARVLDIPYGEADRLAKLIPVVRGKPAKLAEMITRITEAQLLVYRLGRLKDEGTMTFQQVSMAKRNNCEMARKISRTSREILGANGITKDYSPIRHMANIESVYTYEGTHEMHSLILGQEVTGMSAYDS